jgi:two-component system NarL family sensor kinase
VRLPTSSFQSWRAAPDGTGNERGSERGFTGLADAASEAERRIAWLRLAAVPLITASVTLPHPHPEKGAFFVAAAVVGAYALGALAWAYLRPATRTFVFVATALDVAAISVLARLSGGAFSEARLAYFLIPVAVAFRFRPALTAAAGAATVAAYLVQAFSHPARRQPGAGSFIAIQTGFLLWLGLAAVLLSAVLWRRTARVSELAEVRRRLIADSLTARERERKALAEGLHDHAIQNLLSARLELEEAADELQHPALLRADAAVAATIGDLREAVFQLHPYVLEQAGLEAAVRSIAQRAARLGGFSVQLDLHCRRRHPHDTLVLGATHELLANSVQHAAAESVVIRLADQNGAVTLEVRDDGRGFEVAELPGRLAEGHIGLQSQRERIETVGGRMEIQTAPGRGTTVKVRIPV